MASCELHKLVASNVMDYQSSFLVLRFLNVLFYRALIDSDSLGSLSLRNILHCGIMSLEQLRSTRECYM
jgi:hypothetical protein